MKHHLIKLSAAIFLSLMLTAFTDNSEILYEEVDGVRITYTKQQQTYGSDQVMEYVVLKIENRNTYAITAKWKLDLWYNENCRTCNQPSPSGYEFSIDMKPGEVIQGDVSKDDLMLRIWRRNIRPETDQILTRFVLTNLKITRL
jgi:hypothetical protein